jgi:deoxyxylulose-5-phosphate synthase
MEKVKTPNRYLDMVDHPAHVKKLTVKQLEKLAEELREELITAWRRTAATSARTSAWWS